MSRAEAISKAVWDGEYTAAVDRALEDQDLELVQALALAGILYHLEEILVYYKITNKVDE